jgi:PAS domain S-box-containing protein
LRRALPVHLPPTWSSAAPGRWPAASPPGLGPRSRSTAPLVDFQVVFQGLADPIAIADPEGRLLQANDALARLTGHRLEALSRLRMDELIVPGSGRTAVSRAQFEQTGRWVGERELRRADGATLPVDLRTQALRPGPETLYVSVFRDLADRRAEEQAQDEYVALVGHELKGSLTLLIGWVEILDKLGAFDNRAVRAIQTQTGRLNRLVGDLLDVTRPGGGQLRLFLSQIDLVETLRTAALQAETLSAQHPIRLQLPDEPLILSLDQDRLLQVLENLISNAVKYSPAGGEIVLALEAKPDQAVITLRDQGLGIAPDLLPRLFEPYYRAASTADSVRGLGLGLYISRLLVQAHGGQIEATSQPNHGSTFTITLPRHPAQPPLRT